MTNRFSTRKRHAGRGKNVREMRRRYSRRTARFGGGLEGSTRAAFQRWSFDQAAVGSQELKHRRLSRGTACKKSPHKVKVSFLATLAPPPPPPLPRRKKPTADKSLTAKMSRWRNAQEPCHVPAVPAVPCSHPNFVMLASFVICQQGQPRPQGFGGIVMVVEAAPVRGSQS